MKAKLQDQDINSKTTSLKHTIFKEQKGTLTFSHLNRTLAQKLQYSPKSNMFQVVFLYHDIYKNTGLKQTKYGQKYQSKLCSQIICTQLN